MVDIRPQDLPPIQPLESSNVVIVDQGVDGVRKATSQQIVDFVAPVASQSESAAGSNNIKRMTPLSTKQSIASEVGISIASSSQGSKADSAIQSVNGKSGNSITLDKSDIGLGNVDNTSDVNKPISSATQAALNGKASSSQGEKADTAVQSVNSKTGNSITLVKGDIGLGNVDNTSDANKPVSSAAQSALDLKANSSISVSSGAGLTGGGNLTVNRTISLSSTSIASLSRADSSVQTVNGISPTSGNVNIPSNEVRLQNSRASAITATFTSNDLFVRTSGYYAPGDGGGALYKRVTSEPSHSGKFQSSDGTWWELSEPFPNNRMFGAKVDGTRRNYTILDTGEWGNLASFGVGTSGKTDDTLANQGLIDYVYAKGGGCGYLCSGVSVTGLLTLKSGVVLVGQGGRSGTILMLKDSTNANMIEGQDFNTLWGTSSKQGIHHAGLIGVTLDGNWFNNTAGSGIAVYGYSNLFRDVTISLFREHGMMTMWNSGGPMLGVESTYDNVYIDTVGKNGIWNRGPNDSKYIACVVIDGSQSADHSFDAWRFENFSPSRIVGCHANNRMYGAIQSFTSTNGTLAFRHNVALHDLGGGLDITASHFEGAWYANAIFNGDGTNVDSSCQFYAPWNGINVIIKKMIKFEGRVSGPGAGRPNCIGIKLGDSDNGPNNLSYSIVNCLINGCSAGTLDWTYAGNGMHVTARGFQSGGPSKIGTVPAGTITSVLIGGASDSPY